MDLFKHDVANHWLQEQEQKLNRDLAIPRHTSMAMRPDQVSMDDLKYLTKECTRQHTNPMRVLYMAKALKYARFNSHGSFKLEDVLMLGYLIEPGENFYGVRYGGVMVGGKTKLDHRQIPRALTNLIDAQDRISSDEWYREFEEIHPFFDGNGRTGSLLWNWLNDTLNQPTDPPDFWGFYEATGVPRNS